MSQPPAPDATPLPHLHSNTTNKVAPAPGAYLRHVKWGNPAFDVQPITEEESGFRHSGWAVRRSQIWTALNRLHAPDARLSKFANCGSGLWLEVNRSTNDLRCRSNKCHDRWCMRCQGERAALITDAVARLVSTNGARFLTLTLRHSPTPLTDQIDRLYASFLRLRHRAAWKEHVTGGAAFFEAKVGEKDGLWHVHLHCLITGSFWDQRDISRAWHSVTGDSSIVDVRKVDDVEGRARYVTKYVTKPADSSVFAVPDRLDEMITALRGRRLCTTFGTWRGTRLEELDAPSEGWTPLQSVEHLRTLAGEGDPDARRWLDAAARKWPLFAAYFTSTPAG